MRCVEGVDIGFGRLGIADDESDVDAARCDLGDAIERGPQTVLFMGLTQTGRTISVPHMLQEQIDHLTCVIKRCRDEGLTKVEATEEAEAEWQKVVASVNEGRRPFQEACTPGYCNAEGKAEDRCSAIGSGIFFPSTAFFDMWEKWRAAGDFAGLSVA